MTMEAPDVRLATAVTPLTQVEAAYHSVRLRTECDYCPRIRHSITMLSFRAKRGTPFPNSDSLDPLASGKR